MSPRFRHCVGFIGLTALLAGCAAPHPFRAAERFEKSEHMVPMRDGASLFTAVYRPRGVTGPLPILLCRTPYSVNPYGPDNYKDALGPSPRFHDGQYILAYQDVRGCYMSEGEFTNMRPHRDTKGGSADVDESSDCYDTVEWLIHHVPGNNGRVGLWGISYPGFYVSASIIDTHPAIRAASPQAPISDWYVGDDMHHNGALCLYDTFYFFYSFGQPRPARTTTRDQRFDFHNPDAYDFFLKLGPVRNVNPRHFRGEIAFWNDLLAHPNYDEFWQSRNLLPHLRNIRTPVLTVGGWFDAEDLYGALHTYAAIEANNPGIENTLVMGPWVHGGWSRTDGDALHDIGFGAKTSHYYRDYIEKPFFDRHLRGTKDAAAPEALIFATGSNRWMSFDRWPPADLTPRSIYLAAAGTLADAPPADAAAFEEFVSDPASPVPYSSDLSTPRRNRIFMIEDQRFAARRPDVLTYAAAPADAPYTVAGPVEVELFVETTGSDADFVVKLIDQFPDQPAADTPNPRNVALGGYQMLIRGEVMRSKYRDSFEHPTALVPGAVATVRFTLPDVCHTFETGHRMVVQVQSSWFPMIDRNPQTFCDTYTADESAFIKALHRVHRSSAHASHIRVGVLQSPKLALAGATPARS